MPVAEGGAHGVVALEIPSFDGDAGKFFGAVAAILVAENIHFADVLRTWRMLAQKLCSEKTLRAVIPENAQLVADELDVGWFRHLKWGVGAGSEECIW